MVTILIEPSDDFELIGEHNLCMRINYADYTGITDEISFTTINILDPCIEPQIEIYPPSTISDYEYTLG